MAYRHNTRPAAGRSTDIRILRRIAMRYKMADCCLSFNGPLTWTANRRRHYLVQRSSILLLFLSAFGIVVWPDCSHVAKLVATSSLLLLAFQFCYQPAILLDLEVTYSRTLLEPKLWCFPASTSLKQEKFPSLYLSKRSNRLCTQGRVPPHSEWQLSHSEWQLSEQSRFE